MRKLHGKSAEIEKPPHPMEAMRQAYPDMEITFQEEDITIFTRLNLENLEVNVGEAAGEFLRGLNFNAWRKFWKVDHNDGEIRLAAYTAAKAVKAVKVRDGFSRSFLLPQLMIADTRLLCLTMVISWWMRKIIAAEQFEAKKYPIRLSSGRRKVNRVFRFSLASAHKTGHQSRGHSPQIHALTFHLRRAT